MIRAHTSDAPLGPAPRLRPPCRGEERGILVWLAEIAWWNEQFREPVTRIIWQERIRTDIPPKSAARHFERVKRQLLDFKIPHELERVEQFQIDKRHRLPFIGIWLRVPRSRLDEFFRPEAART